jgi:hypothetical protein
MSRSALDANPSGNLPIPSIAKIIGPGVNKLTPDWTAIT